MRDLAMGDLAMGDLAMRHSAMGTLSIARGALLLAALAGMPALSSARASEVSSLAFAWPVCGTQGRGLSYQMRADGQRVSLHRGLDLGNRDAIPVRAGAAGRVSASEKREGLGLAIEIAHDQGYRTIYANLKSSGVAAGEIVGRGQVIGETGSSGAAQAKLHFEVHKGEVLLDPLAHLEKDEACAAAAAVPVRASEGEAAAP